MNSIGPLPPLSPQIAFNPTRLDRPLPPASSPSTGALGGAHDFGSLFTKLIDQVDTTHQVATAETEKVMLGQSNELHSAVLSLQESSLALSLMVQVRNKLVESYQELMRMPV